MIRLMYAAYLAPKSELNKSYRGFEWRGERSPLGGFHSNWDDLQFMVSEALFASAA